MDPLSIFLASCGVVASIKALRRPYPTSLTAYQVKLKLARTNVENEPFVATLFPNVRCNRVSQKCFSLDDEGQELPGDMTEVFLTMHQKLCNKV